MSATGPITDPPNIKRDLPTLAKMLDSELRADGYEEWVATTLQLEGSEFVTESEKSFLRMLKIFLVATTEALRIEEERHGHPKGEAILNFARAAGVCTLSATLGILPDNAPFNKILSEIVGEFRTGAKRMLASHLQHQRRG